MNKIDEMEGRLERWSSDISTPLDDHRIRLKEDCGSIVIEACRNAPTKIEERLSSDFERSRVAPISTPLNVQIGLKWD